VEFIARADLTCAIQGTIALEAALLGKPVLLFGDSPVKAFPTVCTVGRTVDLPHLMRSALATPVPPRAAILSALRKYLAPFYPASAKDGTVAPTADKIGDFAQFFTLLAHQVSSGAVNRRAAPP